MRPTKNLQLLASGARRAPLQKLIFVLAAIAALSATGHRPPAAAQNENLVTVVYARDDSMFPNPERGFFQAYQPEGGGLIGQQDTPHPPLNADELRALRNAPEAITLIRDSILIPRRFWTEPISSEYLNEIQRNFDAVRAAGLKTIPHFLYDWSMQNRDPDEAVINRHLDQLTPLLRKNADVIAWVQGGLFGGSGEQNASDHGYVYLKHLSADGRLRWQGLSPAGRRLLLKELQAIPADRMMNVRYPRLKWDLFGWDWQTAMANARTTKTAYNSTDAARVGFYNQGFMGSPEHYAMFQLPREAQFMAQDCEFVVHEGEISDAGEYKLRVGQVVRDMEKYHQSALHRGGDAWPQVAAVWKRNGDYDEIARRMGYRFRLIQATLPRAIQAGDGLQLRLEIANDGFARPFNPRDMKIVLRESRTGAEYSLDAGGTEDNRLRLPGPGETKTLFLNAEIPNNLPIRSYQVFLCFPDPYPSLAGRPEYSIRLANKNVWEAATGFNSLQHTLHIISLR